MEHHVRDQGESRNAVVPTYAAIGNVITVTSGSGVASARTDDTPTWITQGATSRSVKLAR